MKALHFHVPGRKTGKFFMVLLLAFFEKMELAKLGGFDEAIGTVGWIRDLIQSSIKMPDREMYIFRGFREQLDFIAYQLAEKHGWKHDMTNILSTPTFPELLAKEHDLDDEGILKLYIDHELPLLRQRQGMLYATYLPLSKDYRHKYLARCVGRQKYMRTELGSLGVGAIVTRGYFQKGYQLIIDDLLFWDNHRLLTKIVDFVDYPTLLLRSVL